MKRTCADPKKAAKKHKGYVDDYKEGELGVIEAINLVNFMCHDNLNFKFGPHMNFIIGQNGSGKSAILNALILAFGARSTTTGRSSSIKNFIKTGKQKAKIEIVLRNKGDSAYKPDEYGEKIIVVREILSSGSSSYKLKSEDGSVISTQKNDLINVLEAMDIQVDNPISVLTQENSKKFLLSKSAKEENLYKSFYQGTGLELLREKYNEFQRKLGESSELLQAKQEQLIPSLKKEVERLKRLVQGRTRIEQLKNEALWAIVIKMEQLHNEAETEVLDARKGLENQKKELERCKLLSVKKADEVRAVEEEKRGLLAALTQFNDRYEELQREEQSKKCRSLEKKGALDQCTSMITTLNKAIVSFENIILDQKRKNQQDDAAQAAERQRQLSELEAQRRRMEAQKAQLCDARDQKMQEQALIQHKMKEMQFTIDQKNNHIGALNGSKRLAIDIMRDRNLSFGDKTNEVLNAIKSNRSRFMKQPVGPLGLFLKVKESKWSLAVEKAVSSKLLRCFCVDNHSDSKVLRDILRRFYPDHPPTVIVSPFAQEQYDVSRHKAVSKFPTVLDMLDISDVIAANCLIDQCGIENVILMEDAAEATQLMLHQPPRNCRSGYLPNCDQICLHPYRFYSSRDRRTKSILDKPARADVNQLNDEIEQEKQSLELAKRESSELAKRQSELVAEISSLERKYIQLCANLGVNESKAKELASFEERRDDHCYEDDLLEARRDRAEKEEAKAVLQRDFEEQQKELADLRQELQSIRSKTAEARDRYNRLNEKLSDVTSNKEYFDTGKTKFEKAVREKQADLRKKEADLSERDAAVQTTTANAVSKCPQRVPTKRSQEEIKAQIQLLDKELQDENKGDEQMLLKQYADKTKALDKAQADIINLMHYVDRLNRMLIVRNNKFSSIRYYTEIVVNTTFITLLQGNQYGGRLIFDNARKALKMEVSPRGGSVDSHTNHASLSGGERSFVTVAFLLALWEATRMPFKVLDEYDVFMDANNRQLSLDLLSDRARNKTETQFIFLSPLELPGLDIPPSLVKVHQLRAPERVRQQ